MIKPLFTEKSLAEAQRGRFTFKVDKSLGKYQIKTIVEEFFNVDVIKVATANYKGGNRRTMRGATITTTPWKKAVVYLKEGQAIDLFVQEKKQPEKKAKAKKETIKKS